MAAYAVLALAVAPTLALADGVPSCPAVWTDLTGVATFYFGDGTGACSFTPSLDNMFTAVAAPDWNGSSECGRCLLVWGPDASVVVRVTDECPECASGHLDLSSQAFDVIANPIDGIVPIAFTSIECPVTGNLSYAEKDGSNPYWFAVQVRNHRYAVDKVELREDGSLVWQAMARQSYNYFLLTSGIGLNAPFDLRLTDVHGQIVTDPGVIPAVVAGAVIAGTVQFPPCPEIFLDGFETGSAAPMWAVASP